MTITSPAVIMAINQIRMMHTIATTNTVVIIGCALDPPRSLCHLTALHFPSPAPCLTSPAQRPGIPLRCEQPGLSSRVVPGARLTDSQLTCRAGTWARCRAAHVALQAWNQGGVPCPALPQSRDNTWQWKGLEGSYSSGKTESISGKNPSTSTHSVLYVLLLRASAPGA